MDYQAVRETAVSFMLDRDWKRKTAKRTGFEQSLFDHTLIELDAFITLLPLLRKTFSPELTEQEEQILLASVIAHDVGKELDDWQDYLFDRRGFLSDVNRELAEKVVPQLAELLGFTGIKEMLSGVLMHMRGERTHAKNMERLLFGEHTNPRWKTLAELVDDVDNLCSAPGLFPALRYLEERSRLSNHLRTAYHLVQLRGVSTTLLHRAAIDAFVEKGWSPLLHYSNGTIYAASARDEVSEATANDIETGLVGQVEQAMGSQFAQQVVGNPIFTVLPKPELFDYKEVGEYLTAASTRVTANTFARKNEVEKFRVAARYLSSLGFKSPTENQLREQADRIARAYPEMSIFAFFKAMLRQSLLDSSKGSPLKEAYEDVFGKGTFATFKKSPAQLQAAKQLELVIDPFWKLDGNEFGLRVQRVEFVPDKVRQQILLDILTGIANKVYEAMPAEERPQRASKFEEIARSFMNDLVRPLPVLNLDELASQQLRAYAQSKKNARRKSGDHLCPVCNQQFVHGVEAIQDFVPSADSHTNRAVSHSSTSGRGIVICNACKFERFLQQLLLGSKVSEMLMLFPRMNIGHSSGEVLRRKAVQIWDTALVRMTEANPEPDQQLSLSDTHNLAQKLSANDYDVFKLTPAEIVDLITHRVRDNDLKKYRKDLKEVIKQLFDLGDEDELDITDLNDAWATSFATEEDALNALIAGEIEDDDARKIVSEVINPYQSMRIVCQTPHMILVPMTNPLDTRKEGKSPFQDKIRGDWESNINASIRELYFTLILGLALDCSVGVLKVGEAITFEGGEGVSRVPPVPALRDLVGAEWVPIHAAKRWLDAIGAAALLANATEFPARSNLYAILNSPTVGHIVRRIEQKSDSGKVYIEHINLLETIKEVLR